MAFDLSAVIGMAKEVSDRQQSGGGNRPRVIYPNTGTLKVKLLYNPKSNLVARQIRRHKVENTNHTCLSMYGVECPICKAIDNVKNATGVDLWKYNAKTRGITYAQYVGSDNYRWDNDNKEPQVGELILLMYPWTIYQDINRLISMAGPSADQLIALNEGKVVNIIRWRENSQEKYKCEVDAFAPSFKSCENDQKFEEFLNNIPDLNESMCAGQINADLIKDAEGVASAINRDYLNNVTYGGIPTGQSPQMSGGQPQMFQGPDGRTYVLINGQYVPIATDSTPPSAPQTPPITNPNPPIQQFGDTPPWNNGPTGNTPPVNQTPPVTNPPVENNTPPATTTSNTGVPAGMPECFGKHKDNDPKCLACPHEISCMVVG